MLALAGIAVGGAIGSLGRYWVALWATPISRRLPWGTILINIVGSFVISFSGTLTARGGQHSVPEALRLSILVGVCGGFTTFSSFSLQNLDLLRGGALARAFANIALSVVLCLASVALGYWLALRLGGGTA